ncbi:carboxypeptidase-like regulatory domain-containing protein [Puia sp. P3]|uniref:carboxypeptidase-like regulatory domain-containing protein n=1 Tax=Puia sp. P3 TaxID=3423952 RepID=UPI003D67BDF1
MPKPNPDPVKPSLGATISILNTNYSIIADATGHFQLPPNLSAGTYILEVSATGYATTTRTITAHDTQLDIPLTPSSKQLDEVVVTAEKDKTSSNGSPSPSPPFPPVRSPTTTSGTATTSPPSFPTSTRPTPATAATPPASAA